MKLIFCKSCHDIFSLRYDKRYCSCKKSYGYYIDNIEAKIGGNAIPVGFDNKSFLNAVIDRPTSGLGSRFEAFIIPHICNTIKDVSKDEE